MDVDGWIDGWMQMDGCRWMDVDGWMQMMDVDVWLQMNICR